MAAILTVNHPAGSAIGSLFYPFNRLTVLPECGSHPNTARISKIDRCCRHGSRGPMLLEGKVKLECRAVLARTLQKSRVGAALS